MPGKQGGFFKRLKSKQANEQKRKQRGSTGMRKSDRIKKHNALVDINAAREKLKQLDQVSVSSDDGASDRDDDLSSSDSDVPPTAKSMNALRAMLGVGGSKGATAAAADSDADEESDPSVVSASDLADSDSAAADEDDELSADDDSAVDAAIQTCALCGTDLTDAVGAVACPDLQQCYCADCYDGTVAELGYDVVPLDGDDDDDEEEEEEEDGMFGDDDADDLFGAVNADGTVDASKIKRVKEEKRKQQQQVSKPLKKSRAEIAAADEGTGGDEDFDDEEEEESDDEDDDIAAEFDAGANDPTTAEQDERSRAFLPAFDYGRMTDNETARAAVVKTVDAADPWLTTYVADEALHKAKPAQALHKAKKSAAVPDADAFVDAADVPAFSAVVSAGELDAANKTTSNGTVSLHVTAGTASWARAHQSSSTPPDAATRPTFVVPYIWDKWVAYKKREGAETPLTPAARAKLNLLTCYVDGNVNTRTWGNEPSWMDAVALHMLNHWAKTVAAMAANDEVLKARKAARKAAKVGAEDAADDEAAASSSPPKGRRSDKVPKPSSAKKAKDDEDSDDEDLELRDRGFAKTRLLLVVPMRHQALQYLTIINGVLGSRDRVGRERFAMFSRDFSEIDEVVDPKFKKRQEDYRKQFAGNINDTFCVGASLRASGMSVYTHVLNSDLIVCSPLGLRRRVSKDADVLVSLSSIEVAVIDQASTLMMQNWEHVVELMKLTNKMPSDTTEGLSDLRRVYPWALEGKASEHRQTVAISSIAHATINGFLRVACHRGNRGFAKMNCDQVPGVLPVITHGIRQHFMRFKCDSLASLDDTRMEYFKNVVFPSQVKPLVDRNVHTILLVPSSFDFFKVRVFLDEQLRGSFAELTEHTSTKKQRKALGQFSSLERPLLVMTERFYFFKRYFVKHAEALVCYSPPLFPHFYAAFVNNLAHESTNATVVCPFTRYDALELQRVLGTARANAVLTRPTDSFIFASTSKNLL